MREANRLLTIWHRKTLKNQDFCVVSNDCWGAEVYHYFDRGYNTPFIGLFLMAPCYVELLENFHLIHSELHFVSSSKYTQRNEQRHAKNNFYPIGILGKDIEIHFLHYSSEEEARSKWERRLERMNFENLFFKFDGAKDEATDELINRFCNLKYEGKLCLVKVANVSQPEVVVCKDWEVDGAKMFRKSIRKFSITKWLNDRRLAQPSWIGRFLP